MNIDKTHKHRKIFAQLLKEQKNLDYRISVAARDLRDDCASDREFIKWLDAEFGLNEIKACELLDRAAAVSVVSEADDWKELGGFEKIRPVLAFPKREQAAIVKEAKAEVLKIPTVIRRRHPPVPVVPMKRDTTVEMPKLRPTSRKLSDAEVLAQWIADGCQMQRGKLPAEVDVIVRMYVPNAGKRAA